MISYVIEKKKTECELIIQSYSSTSHSTTWVRLYLGKVCVMALSHENKENLSFFNYQI